MDTHDSNPGGAPQPFSAASFQRWMAGAALPLWWRVGADRERGGFFEAIDHGGRAIEAPRRARVQARQVYVFAAALDLGWPGPAREAVEHGLAFILGCYRRDDGLFRTLVHPGGAPADETATLYDQAFFLLALASAARALGRTAELEPVAEAVVAGLRARRAHPAGGFLEADAARPFQSNPHMHLLEACLAWSEAGGGPAWDAMAEAVAALALGRFIDPAGGFLREFFDAEWRPLPGEDGRIVEPGHQFEWAWLLERWGRRSGRPEPRAAAVRLFDIARGHGLDPSGEIVVDAILDDLAPHSRRARLWPQTERIKCALILAENQPEGPAREALLGEAAAAVRGLGRYLATPVAGLWWDKLEPDGAFRPEPAPASSLYHLMGAAAELSRCGAWAS